MWRVFSEFLSPHYYLSNNESLLVWINFLIFMIVIVYWPVNQIFIFMAVIGMTLWGHWGEILCSFASSVEITGSLKYLHEFEFSVPAWTLYSYRFGQCGLQNIRQRAHSWVYFCLCHFSFSAVEILRSRLGNKSRNPFDCDCFGIFFCLLQCRTKNNRKQTNDPSPNLIFCMNDCWHPPVF